MNIAFIVAGDRHATKNLWINSIAEQTANVLKHLKDDDHAIVLHGAARGIDTLAAEWLSVYSQVAVESYPADWNTFGRAAGPRRNESMLGRLLDLRSSGYTVGVLAFHDNLDTSKGTGHMVRIARAAGVPVRECTSKAVHS